MTLLYLYVENYGILKKAEFNFSSTHRFHYDPDKQMLLQTSNAFGAIRSDFFSIDKEHHVVDCISAIIGQNASGKTSVADVLAHIVSIPHPHTEYIVVWESTRATGIPTLNTYSHILLNRINNEDDFQARLINIQLERERTRISDLLKACYVRNNTDGYYTLNRTSPQYQDALNYCDLQPFIKVTLSTSEQPAFIDSLLSKPFRPFHPELIYISNNYTPFGGVIPSCSGISNLSTSWLIKADSATYRNPSTNESPQPKTADSDNHDKLELLRMVRLFHAMSAQNMNGVTRRLSISRPTVVLISTDGHEIQNIAQYLQAPTIRKDKTDIGLTALATAFQDIVFNIYTNSANWSHRCFAAFLGNWMKYLASNQIGSEIWEAEFESFISEFTNKFGPYNPTADYESQLSEYLRAAKELPGSNALSRFLVNGKTFKNASVDPDKHLMNVLNLLRHIEQHPSWRIVDKTLHCDLQSPDLVSDFMLFVDLYFSAHTITHFVNFRFHPHLSAGEYSQYFLYSRLYHLLVQDAASDATPTTHGKPRKDFILFFDEIEVTIHPDLQRQLVSNVIVFLESTFGRSKHYAYKFHVIFASHSPILLSDIPRSHVAFLKREPDSTPPRATVLSDEEIKSNATFGANIHTLYKDSFFLESGLIGSFALDAITRAVKELKSGSCSTDLLNFIKIIDEPMIRTSLEADYFANIRKKQPGIEERMLRERLDEICTTSGGIHHE